MNPGKPKSENATITVWDNEREPEMLAHGLSLQDAESLKKPEIEEPKRRTLDDMRRLSEHIKTMKAVKKE